MDNLNRWIKRKGRHLYLPFFFIWNLWKTRNCLIFKNIIPNILRLCYRIMSEVDTYLVRLSNIPNVRLIGDPPECIFPMVFFDGVAAEQVGGVGACIWISEQHFLSIKLGCGHITNTRVELLALWASLYISKDIGLPYLYVFDDSSVIINWAKNESTLSLVNLDALCLDTRNLISGFTHVDFSHVLGNITRGQIHYPRKGF